MGRESIEPIAFLDRFVGRWRGEGTSKGQKVVDEMSFEWVMNSRFLRYTYAAVEGDAYRGEGYLWYNRETQEVELYEFNNGTFPVRIEVGRVRGSVLTLDDETEDRHLRLRFAITADETIEMTESEIRAGREQPFAEVCFSKIAD